MRREVVEVVTPGLVGDPRGLEAGSEVAVVGHPARWIGGEDPGLRDCGARRLDRVIFARPVSISKTPPCAWICSFRRLVLSRPLGGDRDPAILRVATARRASPSRV